MRCKQHIKISEFYHFFRIDMNFVLKVTVVVKSRQMYLNKQPISSIKSQYFSMKFL